MSVIVGIDVGGTFTDLFRFDSSTRTFTTAKVPSRRGDEAQGFLNGLAAIGGAAQGSIVHGTTVGTNTLLERRGPKIGVITTRGFRDVLEMRRRDRRRTWGLWGDFTPIADRDMRLEVAERTLADGTVRTAVNVEEVRNAARKLIEAGAQAVAVIFINAYANAGNERRALGAVREVWPNDYVCASHEVLSEIREFERASTAAINAYLQPVVASYIAKLEAALAGTSKLHIVQSNGGIMSTATARRLPVRTALSGPAAGVVAGAALAKAAGFDNLITCDLGGTSFDVSVIANGKASIAAQTTIEFGLVIRTPMVEITTIGAGGGSIAWVDRGGLLQVGPKSAGSVPGPACYGQGNTRPTLTDAQVVLGRINAQRPLGGELKSLDVEAARRAIAEHVGRPLSLSTDDAAAAVVRVADARMAGAIRLVSIERGHDPQKFVAMPFGGGGALHVGALIRESRAEERHGAAVSRHHLGARLRAGGPAPRHGADREPDARRSRCRVARRAHGSGGQGGERGDHGRRHSGRAHRRDLRTRHALSRADAYRVGTPADRGGCARPDRSARTQGVRANLFGLVQPPASRPCGTYRLVACRRDRAQAAVRFLGVRARCVGLARQGEGRVAQGVVSGRLPGDKRVGTPRAAGRRDN